MPFKKIDDSQTIIYKLVCSDINITDCYVGHTTDFTRRKQKHKSDCNDISGEKYNLNVYSFIRDNGGWDNWSMVIIENYTCNSSLESNKQERYYNITMIINKQFLSDYFVVYYLLTFKF